MEAPPSHPLSVAEARKRLGLGEHDHLADYLPHWKEVEVRLARLTEEAEDPGTKAGYANDLESLRHVLRVLEEVPRERRGKTGFVVWLMMVGLLAGGGYYGYQQWAGLDQGYEVRREGLG